MKTIHTLLDQTLVKFSSRPLYHLSPISVMTYGEFGKEVRKFEYFLQQKNINKGDRCLIVANNSPKMGALLYALNAQGCVAVPIYPGQKLQEKQSIVNKIKPRIIFNTSTSLNNNAMTLEINHESIVINDQFGKITQRTILPSDLALIINTSGTSGEAKGVMLTNSNVVSSVEAINESFSGEYTLNEFDKSVQFLPLQHCFGLGEFYRMTGKGASIHINQHITQLVQDFSQYNPTVMCGVPRLFQMIHNKMPIHNSKYLPFVGNHVLNYFKSKIFGKNLRYAICGGAYIDKQLLQYFDTLGLEIFQGFGSTETSAVATLNSNMSNLYGSVGKALPGVELKIAHDKEIWVSGPNVANGYLDCESDQFVNFNGKMWYATGDTGYINNDYLFVNGRKSSTYKLSNGKFVNPEKLEAILCSIPEISQCMIFSPDGVTNCAIIVSDQSKSTVESKANKLKPHFNGYDFPTKFIISNEPFTQEFLTPKQSLKRNLILEKFNKCV